MAALQAQSMALSCDDSYISLLLNSSDGHETLMSDDKYAEELQLQEAIMSSLIHLQKTPNISENTSIEIGESSSDPQKRLKKIGESSQTLCEICAEPKDRDQIFAIQSCTHEFCTECITKHISITINKRKNYESAPTITCPTGCVLEVDTCREIVPKEVVTMWDELITESMIPSSQRFYCPYKNCSALLVNDGAGDRTVVLREAECPFCRRLFCVRCYVPWHAGVSCDEFSKMSENEKAREDLMVHELAKEKKWQRCPSCKFFVEKNEGCLHMTCRCGFQFCYGCGAAWSSTHGVCQRP